MLVVREVLAHESKIQTTNASVIISFEVYNPNILLISKIEFVFEFE